MNEKPGLLIIDDELAWDTKKKEETLYLWGIEDIADVTIISGQNPKGRNNIEETISLIKNGWEAYPRWSLALIDLQFNTGPPDDWGKPTPTRQDGKRLFGIEILKSIAQDDSLRDLPAIVFSWMSKEELEKREEILLHSNIVWDAIPKNNIDKERLIQLLIDYGLLEDRHFSRLLPKFQDTKPRDDFPSQLKSTLESQILEKLSNPNFTKQDASAALRKIVNGIEAEEKSYIERNESEIIGHSIPLLKAMREVRKIARHPDMDILLLGESGVGKELFAELIHRCSDRRNKKFEAINCAAIPEHLFEAELFGYEAGAFTDALRGGKPGLLEIAGEGTIFLDEIGDLSLQNQAKLLRAIQTKTFFPLGGTTAKTLSSRLIYATNKNLDEEVRNKKFRSDLNFRINFPPIKIPSLKEKGAEDILALTETFTRRSAKKMGKEHVNFELSPQAGDKLINHSWPGNVRELEQVVKRFVYRKNLKHITPDDIDLSHLPDSSSVGFSELFEFIRNCDFDGISSSDLNDTLKDLQLFIIKLLIAAIDVYIKEGKTGRLKIDPSTNLTIDWTGLMKRMTGDEALETAKAKDIFKKLTKLLEKVAEQYLKSLPEFQRKRIERLKRS
jgi:DNA-binding NtrC family response regulator